MPPPSEPSVVRRRASSIRTLWSGWLPCPPASRPPLRASNGDGADPECPEEPPAPNENDIAPDLRARGDEPGFVGDVAAPLHGPESKTEPPGAGVGVGATPSRLRRTEVSSTWTTDLSSPSAWRPHSCSWRPAPRAIHRTDRRARDVAPATAAPATAAPATAAPATAAPATAAPARQPSRPRLSATPAPCSSPARTGMTVYIFTKDVKDSGKSTAPAAASRPGPP